MFLLLAMRGKRQLVIVVL